MKWKTDFVTNSSSTAYVIQNTSGKELTLADFALENIHLFDEFLEQFDWYKDDSRYTKVNLLESAANEEIIFKPADSVRCIFGDEAMTVVGCIYDYMLRDGGESENFIWRFQESLR